jgi:protease-4
MSTAESLMRRLQAFKAGGKRAVHCHTEGAANVTYFLMTACDTIGLAPTGQITITGTAAMPLHLKGLLDKLGVKADFIHVGDYKGAAEPLTLDRPSKAMQETISGILDEAYSVIVKGIATGRGIPEAEVAKLIDQAVFNSKDAVKAKLVDQESIFETFRSDVVGELEWRAARFGRDSAPGFGKIMELLGMSRRTRPSEDHVAVVHAEGNIIDGKGEGIIGSRKEIASRTLSSTLRVLAQEDSVKAVVLRVNSGGGSALASEIIWHAVDELKAKKPVVVSMGAVAASGGYYISCGANRIFAERNTLTGSIGVVGGKIAIEGALAKLGIKVYPVGRGKRALLWSSLGTWSPEERALVQKMMEDVYKIFVGRVAAGRGKSYEEIHKVAQGRVWTGAAALERGLVDEIGGLNQAIAHAEKLGGVSADAPLEVYPPDPTLIDFMNSFTGGISAFAADATLAQARQLLGDRAATVIAATLRQVASFQNEAVQTTLLLPVIW